MIDRLRAATLGLLGIALLAFPAAAQERTRAGAETRVVGGIDAADGAYPFYVRLAPRGRNSGFCGAALIHPQWLMTAAHCVQKREKPSGDKATTPAFQVRALVEPRGDGTKLPPLEVARIVPHPRYDEPWGIYNDVALIKLAERVPFVNRRPPKVLSLPAADFRPAPGREVRIVGYGRTSYGGSASATLREATTRLVARGACGRAYRAYEQRHGPIDKTRICADVESKGKLVDSCQGDSGGPLLTRAPSGRWMAAGIVSYGHKCAEPGFPGVYANVAHYLPWIRSVMGDDGLQIETTAASVTVGGATAPSPAPAPTPTPTPPPAGAGDAAEATPDALASLDQLIALGGVEIGALTKGRLGPGSPLTFGARSRVAGDLYVFDLGSDGGMRRLFPNDRSLASGRGANVAAGQARMVPGPRDGFRLRAPDVPTERLIVAIVIGAESRLGRVALSRQHGESAQTGSYLRQVLDAIERPCLSGEIACALGALRLTING